MNRRPLKPRSGPNLGTTTGLMEAWRNAGAMKPGEAQANLKAAQYEGSLLQRWRQSGERVAAANNAKPSVSASAKAKLEKLRELDPEAAKEFEQIYLNRDNSNN